MNRNKLEEKFPNSKIKQRRGRGGKMFSYVEGSEYIRRLNDAFDGNWSFEIVDHQNAGSEVIVIGKLTAEGIVKTAFGGSSISVNTNSGEIVCLADDYKSAATDALKKASSMFGVGLHMYSDEETEIQKKQTGYGQAKPASKQTESTPGVLSPRQMNAILAMTRKLGWSKQVTEDWSKEHYEMPVASLSVGDASDFINNLQMLLNGPQPK